MILNKRCKMAVVLLLAWLAVEASGAPVTPDSPGPRPDPRGGFSGLRSPPVQASQPGSGVMMQIRPNVFPYQPGTALNQGAPTGSQLLLATGPNVWAPEDPNVWARQNPNFWARQDPSVWAPQLPEVQMPFHLIPHPEQPLAPRSALDQYTQSHYNTLMYYNAYPQAPAPVAPAAGPVQPAEGPAQPEQTPQSQVPRTFYVFRSPMAGPVTDMSSEELVMPGKSGKLVIFLPGLGGSRPGPRVPPVPAGGLPTQQAPYPGEAIVPLPAPGILPTTDLSSGLLHTQQAVDLVVTPSAIPFSGVQSDGGAGLEAPRTDASPAHPRVSGVTTPIMHAWGGFLPEAPPTRSAGMETGNN